MSEEQADRLAIQDLVLRERAARDACLWDEMAGYYHPDSDVEVSWFKGSGADFVAGSKKLATGVGYTFHDMGTAIVTVRGDRALADFACVTHGFLKVDGVEVDVMSHGRLQWRASRADGRWMIAGMRPIYIRDCLIPVNPARVPDIDQALYDGLRPSYRSIAYVMARIGKPVPDTLAGVDRPDTVAALREVEQRWLERT